MCAITAIYQDGVFRPTQPVELPDRCEVELEIRVRTKTDSPGSNGSPTSGQSIEDKLAALAGDVPTAEWDRLPTDLSDQLDHYVYGTPPA